MRTIFNMLAVGAVLLAGLSSARAADPVPPGGLTEAALKDLLDDEGYEVITTTDTDGGKQFLISFTKNKLEHKVLVAISPNRSKIWMSSTFTGMPPADKLTAEQMLKLLTFNSKSASFVIVDENTKKIYLKRPFDNRNVTSSSLRVELDKYTADVNSFQPIWLELRGRSLANNR
jgi:hypothetical protein